MRVFVVAAVLGVTGMFMEEAWLTGAAIAVLLVGMLLRYPSARNREASEDEGGDSDTG